jgi:hypothetical protein
MLANAKNHQLISLSQFLGNEGLSALAPAVNAMPTSRAIAIDDSKTASDIGLKNAEFTAAFCASCSISRASFHLDSFR